jgi:hypothetical protein
MIDTISYFTQLGDLVDQRWTARGRQASQLTEIAASALQEIPFPEAVTPSSILELLAAGTDLPKQRSSTDIFGEPPSVMYRTEDFEVQALTWMEGNTDIHQHGFDGAFLVLAGSSLHVEHRFDKNEASSDNRFIFGELSAGAPEILKPGDIRPIPAGSGFIHVLFHLERPSVTVVVRNGSSELPYPQYSYRLPGLGYDGLLKDDRLSMRLRGLHSLYRIDPQAAFHVALDVIRSQDMWTAFRVCDYWAHNCSEQELHLLVETLAARGGALAELLEPMYSEEMRRTRIMARRGLLREQRHRLLLALIVNLPDRESIESAVSQIQPDEDPASVINRWIRELASPEFRGISGLSLRQEELDVVQAMLFDRGVGEALEGFAAHWDPPSLLKIFFA